MDATEKQLKALYEKLNNNIVDAKKLKMQIRELEHRQSMLGLSIGTEVVVRGVINHIHEDRVSIKTISPYPDAEEWYASIPAKAVLPFCAGEADEIEDVRLMMWAFGNGWLVYRHRNFTQKATWVWRNGDSDKNNHQYTVDRTSEYPQINDYVRKEIRKHQHETEETERKEAEDGED